jgi:hypothetical protein
MLISILVGLFTLKTFSAERTEADNKSKQQLSSIQLELIVKTVQTKTSQFNATPKN